VSWRKAIPQFVKRPLRRLRSQPARPASDAWFDPSQIDELRRVYFEEGSHPGGPWDRYREAHMVLPDWFRSDLDPWGEAYACQQERVWRLVSGVDRAYDPSQDEKETGWNDVDPIKAPGFYARRDDRAIASASDHVIATGMLLKHCGLQAGDRALEYGAGFGQSALALARLGVNVDTVDISPAFCDFVRVQAEHFSAPLTPFHGRFGSNPRPGHRYKLIWFYESFHHCVDFLQVVPQVAEMLDDGGRIILGGEPIFPAAYEGIPYPWGVRLHSEVAAVMRQNGWFELGFTEAFLYELFRRSGMAGRRIDCDASDFGRLYVFTRERDGR
jgi:SAM-dependent methyltransferase